MSNPTGEPIPLADCTSAMLLAAGVVFPTDLDPGDCVPADAGPWDSTGRELCPADLVVVPAAQEAA